MREQDMDDKRLLRASNLRDEGRFKEAITEFTRLAEDTPDPIDKAGILLNAATTLRALGECDLARSKLDAVRELVPPSQGACSNIESDSRSVFLTISVEIEEADICRVEGNKKEALAKLDDLMSRCCHKLQEPDFRGSYENIQTLRGFLLVDLGRWNEALPILEEAQSFEEPKALIDFYLGYCYVAAHEHAKGRDRLLNALRSGLPHQLEFRAHCALGKAYHKLEYYAQAKLEFEKCIETADTSYIWEHEIWRWLEITCRHLGLKDEAEKYAGLASGS